MCISRLLQRAGARWAASVALFVALIPHHALALEDLAPSVRVYGVSDVVSKSGSFEATYTFQRQYAKSALDGVDPWKTDFVKKRITVPKRGNPVKWFKKSPWELGVMAAIVAGGWAFDELNNQVNKINYRDNDLSYYWRSIHGHTAASPEELAEMLDSYVKTAFPYTEYGDYWIEFDGESKAYVKWNIIDSSWIDSELMRRSSCDDDVSICTAPIEELEPVTDTELFDLIDEVLKEEPESVVQRLAVDAAGNPYIYPEVAEVQEQLADAIGAEALPSTVIVNDPYAGQGYESEDGTSPTPSVTLLSPGVAIPDDYARENTLTQVKDWLLQQIEEKPVIVQEGNNGSDVLTPLTDQFENLPAFPDIDSPGDFGIDHSSSCETITFSWRGSSVTFPDSGQCDKIQSAQKMLGWFLYVVTFFGCIYTILGARKFQV